MKIADGSSRVGGRRQRRHSLIQREKLIKALVRKGADESMLHGLTPIQLAALLRGDIEKLTKARRKKRG